MDLRQLNTFVQVAGLGSLSRAADRLRIAQPALSRQVRMLEQELGTPLFVRHGRGMVLTHAGEMLRERALSILAQVEEARAALTVDAGVVRGQVVFGVPPTVGDVLATRLVERFMAQYPGIRLRVVNAFGGYLLEWLHGGEVDVAVVYGTGPDANISMLPLLRESLYFLSSPDHPASGEAPIALEDVAACRLILPGPRHGLRILIEKAAQESRLTLDVPVEADALQVLKGLVLKGLGATILPRAAVLPEVRAGSLTTRLIERPALSRNLVVAQPIGRPASVAVRHFVQVLRQEVGTMVEAGLWDGTLP